jgi:hypothetical protein
MMESAEAQMSESKARQGPESLPPSAHCAVLYCFLVAYINLGLLLSAPHPLPSPL